MQLKGSESGPLLPSTSMAAHAIDELIEVIEMEKIEVVDAASRAVEKGNTDESAGLPYLLPPPPPAPQNAYNEYECDDEDVDVEQLDQEMGCVDVNSEVDIEKL
ncbi:hypothetical protein HHK36_002079 [Tetracentron sinense]|uniref:Uncharacterized protein n=1 Tax=Tetracentron sinense TaxID=13715 RepID=A0A834ZUH9_TETSI|nr:hypothetical protein HHK36_002079 [Tetracentron sinense]